MGDIIARPVFYEGQILAAADLQAEVDHAAGQQARHERYLHLWGIASGLTLDKQDMSTADTPPIPYVEATLKAGVAIDGTGREIVVPDDVSLREAEFDQANVATTRADDWYPVFVVGRDEDGAAASLSAAACTSSQTTRVLENFSIQYGRPGDAANLDDQETQAIGVGAWRVLVGFVQWLGIGKFKAIATSDQGITLRYAGAKADEVAARGGTLVLRTKPRSEAGNPAIIMDAGNGELRFGLQDTSGAVKEVFTVNAKGDVTAKGTIKGAVTPGSVQIQSGTATDGIILPLPPGVTEEMVAPGKGTLHVLLNPRLGGKPTPTSAGKWGSFSHSCYVDDDRRLHCILRWFKLDGAAAAPEDRPGLCDYLLIVAVAAAEGGI